MKTYRIIQSKPRRIPVKRWSIYLEGGTLEGYADELTFLGCDLKVQIEEFLPIGYSMLVQATLEIIDGHAIFKGRYIQ